MRKTALPPVLVQNPARTATVLVILGWLAFLAGCQGAMHLASSSPTPQPTSATLTVTPTTFNLGSVAVGTSKKVTATLTAGAASVTVTSVTTNDSGVFTVGGLTLPITLAAGQSKTFSVTFSPKVSGTINATLTVKSSAQSSTLTSSLTGVGTVVGAHTVKLSWNASTSANITGYNVYRSSYTSSCGSFSKINGVLNTTTLYADAGVADGASYCYTTTAVNSSHVESTFSNIVSNVKIPTT